MHAGTQRTTWVRWLVGAALVATVVTVSLRLSEARDVARLAEQVRPSWLLLAVLLQAATYLAQGAVWRIVGLAVRLRVPIGALFELSLAKLFVDQALPSGGISGTTVVARTLQDRGMPRPVVMAGVVIDVASYQVTYVVCLAGALTIAVVQGRVATGVEVVSVIFLLYATTVVVALLLLAGRPPPRLARRLTSTRIVRGALKFLEDADPKLAHRPSLLIASGLCHLAIFLLDAGTIWVLIRALGTNASVTGVFASFMMSTLFRTIGVVPGGLGTFEATSTLTLKMAGVPLPVALSATLLFRGLSFWLPMLPGLWFSRRALRMAPP